MHTFSVLFAYIEAMQKFKDSGMSFVYDKSDNSPKIERCGSTQNIFLGDDMTGRSVQVRVNRR